MPSPMDFMKLNVDVVIASHVGLVVLKGMIHNNLGEVMGAIATRKVSLMSACSIEL